MDDSPFNEDPKNIIFFREALIFGGGTARKFRENWAKTCTSIVMQIRG